MAAEPPVSLELVLVLVIVIGMATLEMTLLLMSPPGKVTFLALIVIAAYFGISCDIQETVRAGVVLYHFSPPFGELRVMTGCKVGAATDCATTRDTVFCEEILRAKSRHRI